MLLRFCAGLILLLSGSDFLGQVEPPGCLSYEPAVVYIHGTLVRKTFPGPPGYEDIRKGDRAETSWFLNLASPICVNQDKSEPDLNPENKNIRRVQLVLDAEAYDRYKPLLGQQVVAKGMLFGSRTGHHHTPVLLTVTHIERAPSR
jgi:hypothetical protein